jgi:hypothetical protein
MHRVEDGEDLLWARCKNSKGAMYLPIFDMINAVQ